MSITNISDPFADAVLKGDLGQAFGAGMARVALRVEEGGTSFIPHLGATTTPVVTASPVVGAPVVV